MADKIYIVTLKSRDDLESFYSDMSSDGFKIHTKRPISRNTHYYMTDEQKLYVLTLEFLRVKKDMRIKEYIQNLIILVIMNLTIKQDFFVRLEHIYRMIEIGVSFIVLEMMHKEEKIHLDLVKLRIM